MATVTKYYPINHLNGTSPCVKCPACELVDTQSDIDEDYERYYDKYQCKFAVDLSDSPCILCECMEAMLQTEESLEDRVRILTNKIQVIQKCATVAYSLLNKKSEMIPPSHVKDDLERFEDLRAEYDLKDRINPFQID